MNEYTGTNVRLGYTYLHPVRANDPYSLDRSTTGANNVSEEFYAEMSQVKQNQPGLKLSAGFDSEKVREDGLFYSSVSRNMISIKYV